MHGISSKILGEKNKDPHFIKIIQGYDVVALSELHTQINISIPGFHLKKQKFRTKNHKGPKIGGGIAVFVNQNVADNFRLLPNDNIDSIWIKTSLGVERHETRLGFFYCSPERKNSNFNFFDTVNTEVEKLSNGNNTYIFGDFNARTKTVCENIVHDKSDETLGIRGEIETIPASRNSEDLKLVNKRGHDFLDVCRVNDLTIANGRVVGDAYGKYTCHQKKGSSVVDYLIAPCKAIKNINEFKVGEFTPMLSDHCPIMANIRLNDKLIINEQVEVPMYDLPKRRQWSDESIFAFKQELDSEKFKSKVGQLLEKPEGITAEDIKGLLQSVDQMSPEGKQYHQNMTAKKRTEKSKKKNQPWFDQDCQSMKKEITECGKILRSAPEATRIREKIYCLKKSLRNRLRRNKLEFQTNVVDEMCQNMSDGEKKKYWNQLKKLEGSRDGNKYIPDYTLISHFREILHDDNIKLQYEKQEHSEGLLDFEITEEELQKGSKILKNWKGTGIDNLYNEMIKPLVDTYPELPLKLFNDLLQKRQKICQEWLHSLVTAIHKKGAKEDPDNYRGISLMSCLGKLFLTIINNRLTEFCLHKGILTPSQLGFVQGNRTSDPHVILHNVLQKYCHRRKKKVFGCFVDFSKAFDSVPRDLLQKTEGEWNRWQHT